MKKYLSYFSCLFLLFFSCKNFEKSDLELNPLFSNHMVLQQKENVAFWGKYVPNSSVTVKGTWGEASSCTSDNDGIDISIDRNLFCIGKMMEGCGRHGAVTRF